jgi:hypothetical protein
MRKLHFNRLKRNCFAASIVIAAVLPTSARCESIALNCKYLDGTKGGTFAAVNQILIDPERGTLDFRVAETIGTTNPQNYTFQTKG